VHRDTSKASVIDVGDYTEFELLAVKLVGRRAKSVVAACVYRLPGTVTSAFTEQLSDLFDQLVLLDSQFVVLGDFNMPDVTARQLDQRAFDVFTQHGLQQHVAISLAATFWTSCCHSMASPTVSSSAFPTIISSRSVWAFCQRHQS